MSKLYTVNQTPATGAVGMYNLLALLVSGGYVPVLACLGAGEDGSGYNINADVVAAKLATVLKAEKLVLLTNTPGVLD